MLDWDNKHRNTFSIKLSISTRWIFKRVGHSREMDRWERGERREEASQDRTGSYTGPIAEILPIGHRINLIAL